MTIIYRVYYFAGIYLHNQPINTKEWGGGDNPNYAHTHTLINTVKVRQGRQIPRDQNQLPNTLQSGPWDNFLNCIFISFMSFITDQKTPP